MHFADKRTIDKLLTGALAQGWSVSVNDGGAWCLKRSRDKAEIVGALESSDEDLLVFHDGDKRIGSVYLVHGNEPGVIMADHSDNEAISSIVDPAQALGDKLAA